VYHSAAATQPAKEFYVFHQRHLGKSADLSEYTSTAENSMIAASHPEQNACVMRKIVSQSIQGVCRQSNSEKPAGNAPFSQYALDFRQAFRRHFNIYVQKPKGVASCGACAEVQLLAPIALAHHNLIAKACCQISRSIRASAICNNDFRSRRPLAQMCKKLAYHWRLVENWNNDRDLHANNLSNLLRSG
jgi:hypothetical protein